MPACPQLDCFFFNDPATPEIYTLSLHDALPISHLIGGAQQIVKRRTAQIAVDQQDVIDAVARQAHGQIRRDKGLAFRGHAAGDENRLQRGFIARLVNARTEAAKLLDAWAAIRERRKGRNGWLPSILRDVFKEGIGTGRRRLLCVVDNRRLGKLADSRSLRGLPLPIRSLQCFVYPAHISRSFRRSLKFTIGLAVLKMAVGEAFSGKPAEATGEIRSEEHT